MGLFCFGRGTGRFVVLAMFRLADCLAFWLALLLILSLCFTLSFPVFMGL